MERVVFSNPWGGLGDNLCFSSLPERYSEIGKEFYVSSTNIVRNPEIHELVWKNNPYVKGVTDSRPNVGAYINSKYWRDYKPYGNNMVEYIDTAHGFAPKNKYPSVYYKNKNIDVLHGKTLISLSSIKDTYDEVRVEQYINSIIGSNDDVYVINYVNKDSILQHDLFNLKHKTYNFKNGNMYNVTNIFDLCDAIKSCSRFITMYTGTAVLSSALNHNKNIKCDVIAPNKLRNKILDGKLYYYDNNEYHFV